jgi:PHD/YefM family antitoxin component YafN of YafNO toxin-antitoxin module
LLPTEGHGDIEFDSNSHPAEASVLDVSKDIHSLTEFKTKTQGFLDELREVGRALLLTVNGRAEVAVLGAATFQNVLDALHDLETSRRHRDGLDAETTFVSRREPTPVKRNSATPMAPSLDELLLDCLVAFAAAPDGAARLTLVREAFERRVASGKLGSESEARIRIALGINALAKAVGRERSSGDESALGVPVSKKRWERIFGKKAVR